MELIASFSYELLPPLNAFLNSISTILLVTGVILVKAGKKEAHKKAMLGALVSSALFLTSYLFYHYNAGHTEFPKAYPTARKIYLAILIPHIILAVVNLPFIILLVVAAFRGKFERHKKLARFTFPSWLFVSVTGVIIYFMIYQWFPPVEAGVPGSPDEEPAEKVSVEGGGAGGEQVGDLFYSPMLHRVKAEAGQSEVEVVFSLRNDGAEPLNVTELDSGCACLSVDLSENPIPPGVTATITGLFDTSKMRGSTEKKITVATEGRSRPIFLRTKIHVDPLYELEESMTTWEVGSEPEPKVVKFIVMRSSPIHVLNVESMRKEVSCEVVEVKKGREYHLELTPESTDETLLGFLRIETDCEIEQLARPLAYFSIQ